MKKLFSMLIIAGITFYFYSCEKENSLESNSVTPSTEQSRLKLSPGESNWSPKLNKDAGQNSVMSSLSTTSIADGLTPADLVEAIIGSGPNAPTYSNVVFTGASSAAGTFSGGSGVIGFEDGIILSSGQISTVIGPNTQDNATTNLGQPGDADLDALIPQSTNDATILEFDFECLALTDISFQYVFSSDEYNEYVNTTFNDVFAFFLDGVNIALIPSTSTPVSINNVNCNNPYNPPTGSYCDLYINNDLNDGGGTIDTEMDGLTVVLDAIATGLAPGTHHIKLAIADAGDFAWDSNVFIKGNSFICALPQIDVNLDVKPTSCPNPFNMNAKGTLPAAVLGTAEFDVTQIDPSTVTLMGVPAERYELEDVAAPYTGEELAERDDCTTEGPDGFMDMTFKFDRQAVAAALGSVNDGDVVVVELNGQTLDGTDIVGQDIIWIKKKK